MKKFLTIALLVMALCVVSMAVSAAPTATADFENGVATVTVTPGTTGQTVVLVVDGADLADIPNTDAPDTLAQKIIYVDQTAGTAGTPVSFNFIPRTAPSGVTYGVDSTVFYSDGTSVGSPVELYTGTTYIVTLDPGEGELAEALRTVKVKANDTEMISLPTPSRVGYDFDGWYDGENEVADNKINNAIGANKTLTAKWKAYFADGTVGDNNDANTNFGADNSQNEVADAGFVMNGEKKEYVVSVTATVAPTEKTIKGYGFYVYKVLDQGYSAPVIASKEASISAGQSFYAKATGIPETEVAAKIMFKPFIYDTDNNVMWGAATTYSAKDLGAELKDITPAVAE